MEKFTFTPEGHGIAKAEDVESEFTHIWDSTADFIEALETVITYLEISLAAAREEEARAREPMED